MRGILMLTAQGFYSELVRSKFIEVTGDKSNKSIALIVTAAKDKENNKFNLRDRDTLLSMGFAKVDFIDIELVPETSLDEYDIIYVCGGNTFKLLKYAKESNFKESVLSLLKRGGLYFGISAGSLILGPSVILANEVTPDENLVELGDISGLSIIPNTIYPHYSQEVEDDLLRFEKKHGIVVDRLTNDQAIVIEMDPMTLELI